MGTVKTVLNVADLNTKKLTYARRAFLMYFLSQVEYSEGGEITHTGVDEYEKYEQEKKLKEYVNSSQVKDLIRLIQVFSVIKPATAVWIKGEESYAQQPESTAAMEEAKYSRTEVAMLVTVLLVVIPYVWNVARRTHKEWTRLMMVGKVRINSSSRNYIFHRTTCRYVQGEARNGYFIHLDQDVAVERGYKPCYVCFPEAKKAQKQGRLDEDDSEWELTGSESTENERCSKMCSWCETRKCTRRKPDHVHCSCTECIRKYTEDLWRGQYDKVPEQSSSTQGPTGKKGSGTLEYTPPHVHSKGNRPAGQTGKTGKRGRAAVEGRIEPTILELNESLTQEGTPEAEEQPQVYEDMYESMYDGLVDPGTPDSTEARTEGPLAW